MLLRDLAAGALDLLFPPVCAACGEPISTSARERLVCGACWARARPLPPPRCRRCWSPLPAQARPGPTCLACQDFPPALRAIRSAFVMDGPARELVHALKYGGWRAVAAPMAARMATLPLPLDVLEEADTVVPVPISAVRLRERGYNQAALLAEALARHTGRHCAAGLLRRIRSTETQTALHPAERRANVAGAFSVDPVAAPALQRAHLLLVDDVWTTGATAIACTQAMLSAGARAVSVLTFARALPELRRGEP